MANYIVLNVGGVCYTTSRLTLASYSESMLGKMFSDKGVPPQPDENGHFFIDRDGTLFRYILNFMRSKKWCLPSRFEEYDQLLVETEFFGLPEPEKPEPQNPVSKEIVIMRSCEKTENMSGQPKMTRICVVEAEGETWPKLKCLKSASLSTFPDGQVRQCVNSYIRMEYKAYQGNLHSLIFGFIVQDGFKLEGTSSCDGNEALVFSKE